VRPSRFNVVTPIPESADTFLFNTLTDTQIVVSDDVVQLLQRIESGTETFAADERDAINELAALGFVVESAAAEDAALESFFHDLREDHRHLRVTLLTTLQCNFACDYCIQGDHADYNASAAKMSIETAARVQTWLEERLDALRPERFTITFFGGEPLLNLPVVYKLAEGLAASCANRGIGMNISLITNGLLLTEAVVDRLLPYGLTGIKVTLDGDQPTHDRLRPLRGGQGTFARIMRNLTAIAGKVRVSVGGNFDVESAASYPALLDHLRAQPFADQIVKVAFKPVIRAPISSAVAGAAATPAATPATPGARVIPLTPAGAASALQGTCMTAAGTGNAGSPCDSCHVVDDRMSWLRAETRARGFSTPDGVHMGPCELHRRHAYTIGPEGSLYPCPGFTGDARLSVGHIEPELDQQRTDVRDRFDRHAPWRACGDCALVPVCGGGCSVASHTEQGDLAKPSCHRPSMLDALSELAAASATQHA
jgi:uncharacterized protein